MLRRRYEETAPVEFQLYANRQRRGPSNSAAPRLENGTVVEIVGRRTTLERTEGNSGARSGSVVAGTVDVGTERLLFVGSGDDGARRAPVDVPAVARVELVRRPRASEVDALVDRHRLGPHRTELHAHVRHLQTYDSNALNQL